MREQRAGRPVMGGPLLSKGGDSVGDVGGAGDWFGGAPGDPGSDPWAFGVGCGSREGQGPGGATAGPRG